MSVSSWRPRCVLIFARVVCWTLFFFRSRSSFSDGAAAAVVVFSVESLHGLKSGDLLDVILLELLGGSGIPRSLF